MLSKVAGPIGVAVTAHQVATAETTEEKVDAGLSVASTALTSSGNPVAVAAGVGLAGGQVLESTLNVSDRSSEFGLEVNQGLRELGASEDVAFAAGAVATVVATPLALQASAAAKGRELLDSGVNFVSSFF